MLTAPWLDRLVLAIESDARHFEGAELACLKRGRRKALYRTRAPNGAALLVKLNRYVEAVPRARRLRESKARRELGVARRLRERGIDTPLPLAAGEARRAGLLERCVLVLRELPGALDLECLWRAACDPRERRAATREIGWLARRMHSAGLDQRDFAPNNLLRVPGLGFVPIDFERARLVRRIGERRACEMLAQLESRLPGLSAADRWRALLAYCGGDGVLARARLGAFRAARQRIARRELAHWRRTVASGGRRFETLTRGVWRGVGLRGDASVAALDPERPPPAELRVTSLRRGVPARVLGGAHWLYLRGLHAQPVACLRSRSALRLWIRLPNGFEASTGRDAAEPLDLERARARALEELASLLGRVAESSAECWILERLPNQRLRALLCAPPDSVI